MEHIGKFFYKGKGRKEKILKEVNCMVCGELKKAVKVKYTVAEVSLPHKVRFYVSNNANSY